MRIITIIIILLLSINLVSAGYKFENNDGHAFTMFNIHTAKEEYKAEKKLNKCEDKNKVKQQDKCLEKYYYKYSSYIFWVEKIEIGI